MGQIWPKMAQSVKIHILLNFYIFENRRFTFLGVSCGAFCTKIGRNQAETSPNLSIYPRTLDCCKRTKKIAREQIRKQIQTNSTTIKFWAYVRSNFNTREINSRENYRFFGHNSEPCGNFWTILRHKLPIIHPDLPIPSNNLNSNVQPEFLNPILFI